MALKEAKSCRSYDTFELIAKSVPMPPYAFINDVLDPLVAARKEDHRCACVRLWGCVCLCACTDKYLRALAR
jgi:hypothetical protein